MPTITAGDFRKGMIFEMDGKPMLVVDFQHVKPGKGAAFVRTKYKNVISGAVREEAFNPSAKFEQVAVERKNAEYSYNDGDLYYFMDPETYDMVPLNKDVLGDAFQFVKENTMCSPRRSRSIPAPASIWAAARNNCQKGGTFVPPLEYV